MLSKFKIVSNRFWKLVKVCKLTSDLKFIRVDYSLLIYYDFEKEKEGTFARQSFSNLS